MKVDFQLIILKASLGDIYSKTLINWHCIRLQQNYRAPFLRALFLVVNFSYFLSHRFFTALVNILIINCSYIFSNKCWSCPWFTQAIALVTTGSGKCRNNSNAVLQDECVFFFLAINILWVHMDALLIAKKGDKKRCL